MHSFYQILIRAFITEGKTTCLKLSWMRQISIWYKTLSKTLIKREIHRCRHEIVQIWRFILNHICSKQIVGCCTAVKLKKKLMKMVIDKKGFPHLRHSLLVRTGWPDQQFCKWNVSILPSWEVLLAKFFLLWKDDQFGIKLFLSLVELMHSSWGLTDW